MGHDQADSIESRQRLIQQFARIRADSEGLCAPLATEDYVIQTMPDVSPPIGHLAHTFWFFETFVLAMYQDSFQFFHPQFDYLFNSYYVTHGTPYPRPQRGLLSRPTVSEIFQYRKWVDKAIIHLVQAAPQKHWERIQDLIILGLNHEQQHQELLLTDIKHILAHNPLKPAYRDYIDPPSHETRDIAWISFEGGLHTIGHQGEAFAYDNEGPAHKTYTNDFQMASRLITNGEYIEFIDDAGYQQPELWFSEAWSTIQQENWQAPLYWEQRDSEWWHFTLEGMQPVKSNEPVCHISQFEADAYARWAGKRLPNEVEWEIVAYQLPIGGNLMDHNQLKPVASDNKGEIQQLYGDVWEWTASPYSAYPGYKPAAGAIGEYNGKFMSSQIVLRGGSFATPPDHIRPTYRNFFYPGDRWQFSGIRLADDA